MARRILCKAEGNNGGWLSSNCTYGYTNDQVTTFKDGSKEWHLSYDGRDRIEEIIGAEHWDFAYGDDGQLTSASRDEQTWSYTYDPVGNLAETRADGGMKKSQFNHDAAIQIESANSAEQWKHDGAGRLVESSLHGVDTNYTYDV